MRLTVKITPKASRNAITGWMEGENGEKILKISVTTVPEKGKANEKLIEILSKTLKIPKSAVTIVRGETDRLKILEIQGLSEDYILPVR